MVQKIVARYEGLSLLAGWALLFKRNVMHRTMLHDDRLPDEGVIWFDVRLLPFRKTDRTPVGVRMQHAPRPVLEKIVPPQKGTFVEA